jgi:hypothetical protein
MPYRRRCGTAPVVETAAARSGSTQEMLVLRYVERQRLVRRFEQLCAGHVFGPLVMLGEQVFGAEAGDYAGQSRCVCLDQAGLEEAA